ncbi:MAG: hypothetical protein K1X53_14140 [Candidatus Sumerlaeaceae bacterium]|nr:hypothetical protein [Candidatus Sumerlaeaceae bacterium]
MAYHQIGGLVIVLIGVMVFAGSLPVLHLVPRESPAHSISAQVGRSAVLWIVRTFAFITCMLGLVTYLQG